MPAIPAEPVSLEQITAWHDDLAVLQERIAPRFARPEVRQRAGRYVAGLLGAVERRNGWQLAEALGEMAPDGVQRLLRTAQWDAEAVRDDLRSYVVEHLGDPEAVLVMDETGFLKKGTKSAGVARQYSGTAGRIENSQIGVFLAYASPQGQAFLDRALYLPKAWAEDAERRDVAGIPPEVGFATKGDLAQMMLARAFAADVPAAWVTGDEIYGNDGDLRRWLEEQQRPYVLAVARSHPIWDRGRQVRIEALGDQIPEDGWQRLEVGNGSKGPRISDWACARLPYLTEDGWAQWLLLRRSLSAPQEFAYYRAFGREDTPVAELAQVAGTRWVIEEGFQRAKAIGLDQYEVRSWQGWYRHITLCLLAHAFLAVTRAAAAEKGGRPI
ncbi:MAG: IS701 family transposase [Chloroflexota bacterium]|nr:IS701 family transposase [Chloroflexota bacterium]